MEVIYEFWAVTTTEFHNKDSVEVSGEDVSESLDLCLAAEDGYTEDRLSLDSNTVAVDWDREGGNIVVFDNRYCNLFIKI